MTRNLICVILTLACCGFALWRGGGPERSAAAIILAGSIMTLLALNTWAQRFRSIETGALIVDLVVLAAMLLLAVKAYRFWPIGLAGMQLMGVSGHLLALAQPDLSPTIYDLVTALGIYPMLALLVIGTRNHRVRLRRNGIDRSWVISSG